MNLKKEEGEECLDVILCVSGSIGEGAIFDYGLWGLFSFVVGDPHAPYVRSISICICCCFQPSLSSHPI